MKDCKCGSCGKAFCVKDHRPGLFCCRACYMESRPKKKPMACKGCGQTFTPLPRRSLKCKFCCHKCYLDHAKKENHSCYQKEATSCVCRQCQRPFRTTKSSEHRLFCCSKCWREHQTENPVNGFGDCIGCGEQFTKEKSDQICCSRVCYFSSHAMENSRSWKGGSYIRYSDDVEHVHSGEYREPGSIIYRRRPRIVVAGAIGRNLFDDERVWHINRDRQDNSLSNLYLFQSQSEMARAIGSRHLPEKSNILTAPSPKALPKNNTTERHKQRTRQ